MFSTPSPITAAPHIDNPFIKHTQTHTMQSSQAFKKLLKPVFALFIALSTIASAKAEGTKQLSPSADKITALTLIPNRGSGSFLGADTNNRIRFFIDSPDEWLYCGFSWKEYSSSVPNDVAMYYRLYNASGVVIGGAQLPASGAGYITNYTRAKTGPNGVDGVTSAGYNPISVKIATLLTGAGVAFGTGEYSIEFYRVNSNNTPNTDGSVWSMAPFFDITVAKEVNGAMKSIPGRVFCRKWGFVAVNADLEVTAAASSAPSLYSYSEDQTVLKVGFGDSFRPIAYDLAVNYEGVTKTGNFATDRRSINAASSPVIPNGYRLFLNNPDSVNYPVEKITAQPSLANPAITGCSTTLKINFNMPEAGDARILLDMNNIDDYQIGTQDRIIEVFNAPAGLNSIAWDGKDGLGNAVTSSTSMKIYTTYERGRFNIPLYDAEINANGISASTVAPIAIANTTLYWDDSRLTQILNLSDAQANNTTGAGVDNTITGRLSPSHAWNGNGNPNFRIPAPSVSNNDLDGDQFNDFGNVRVINTWGWALQASSALKQVTFGCRTISGNVFHDANGLTDNKVNTTNATAIPTGLYANLYAQDRYVDNDNVTRTTYKLIGSTPVNADGSYSISDVQDGIYFVVLNTASAGTAGTITTTAPVSNLASTWANTGEFIGLPTIAGNDGTVNGIAEAVTVNGANVTNINFGIEMTPVADPKAFQAPNSSFIPKAGGNWPNPTITSNGKAYNTQSIASNNTTLTNVVNGSTVGTSSLSGTDPEDCASESGCAANNTFKVQSIKWNTLLYYDNGTSIIPVTAGTTIANFKPANLRIYGQSGSGQGNTDATAFSFTYSLIDAAGAASAPATYSIKSSTTALPVKLISFEANKAGETVALAWTTAGEQNNDYFEIQHSTDAANWKAIGKVNGQGTTTIEHDYSFTHNNPAAGRNYYRLAQTDLSGATTNSEVRTVIFDGSVAQKISIYPNPASSVLYLNGGNGTATTVSIFNAAGTLIMQQQVANGARIDVSQLVNGMYEVRMLQGETLNHEKLMIIK